MQYELSNFSADNTVDPDAVKKVIFVSGKHYYALEKHREILEAKDVAIVRLESLCPFPILEVLEEVQKFKRARSNSDFSYFNWLIIMHSV